VKPLVILRPEPGGSRTAARAEAMGLQPRLLPLFTIVSIPWTAPDPAQFDTLVLTSANAVRHGGDELDKLKGLPVHAVGQATAALAEDAGFRIASVGRGGRGQMMLPAGQRLLHLAGRDHVGTGAMQIIEVYEARVVDSPPGLEQLRDSVVAVHSPRAGRRLAELVTERGRIAVAAISPAVAEACGTGWQELRAADAPNDSALLALAARLCESPPP
jgi:uroporphyrinogen-III synthase